MSKMGQELEDRLDANKYEMYEALELIRRCIRNSRSAPNVLDTIDFVAQQVLAKIEGDR